MINQSPQTLNFLAVQLNRVLGVISGKCYLIQTPNKQLFEVCFSHKRDKVKYSSLNFYSDKVQHVPSQKHLGLVLDSKPEIQMQ